MSFRPAPELLADPRVRRGLGSQLAVRERRLAGGERPLGWKLGFGSPAAMQKLGIVAPLTGFLTDRSLLDGSQPVSLAGWSRPLLEPELAVRLATELEPGSDRAAAAAAVGAVGPAFELADLEFDPGGPEDVEAVLAGNIFHRHVLLGEPLPGGADAIAALGAELETPAGRQPVADLQAATGDVLDLVRHVADVLGELGLALGAGEVVICGSIVAPIAVGAGEEIGYRLDGTEELRIRFAAGGGSPR